MGCSAASQERCTMLGMWCFHQISSWWVSDSSDAFGFGFLSSHSWKLLFSQSIFPSVPAHQGRLRELGSSRAAAGAGRTPLRRTGEIALGAFSNGCCYGQLYIGECGQRKRKPGGWSRNNSPAGTALRAGINADKMATQAVCQQLQKTHSQCTTGLKVITPGSRCEFSCFLKWGCRGACSSEDGEQMERCRDSAKQSALRLPLLPSLLSWNMRKSWHLQRESCPSWSIY